jgi:hypothetical protein
MVISSSSPPSHVPHSRLELESPEGESFSQRGKWPLRAFAQLASKVRIFSRSISHSAHHLKGTVQCDPPTPFPINSPCAATDWAISVSELFRSHLIRHSNAGATTRLCERTTGGPARRGCPGICPWSAMRLGLHESRHCTIQYLYQRYCKLFHLQFLTISMMTLCFAGGC